jgi:hypothetical protein
VCEEKLRGAYLFFQNKPICEKDFQVKHKFSLYTQMAITYYCLVTHTKLKIGEIVRRSQVQSPTQIYIYINLISPDL